MIISNPRLTFAEGAIKFAQPGFGGIWDGLEDLSHHLNFSLHVPVKDIPKDVLNVILNGSHHHNFEGIIPNLERRWLETDSEWIRGEIAKFMVEHKCPSCGGKRLKKEMLSVLFQDKNIADVSAMSISECRQFFNEARLTQSENKIAGQIIKEIQNRLGFLEDVGLIYLSLEREAATLSGGESQRIRLATQIGSRLSGVLYILDEPSIGLHSRDNAKLIKTLKGLRDLGNTVIVVEHDEETILSADWVVEIGPGAGRKAAKLFLKALRKK